MNYQQASIKAVLLPGLVLCQILFMSASVSANPALSLNLPPGTRLERVEMVTLKNWQDEDFRQAFQVFLTTCRAIHNEAQTLRPAQPVSNLLKKLCEEALLKVPANVPSEIQKFFENRFEAWRVIPSDGEGFLTAYYEPEVPGSLARTAEFSVPLLGRPADLVTFGLGEVPPAGLDSSLTAARRQIKDGKQAFAAFPDRASIEQGALDGQGLELVWLRDWVDLFMIHVQGSTRVRLQDGTIRRFAYAGRNGHAYSSIGKIIVAEGHMPLETMTLAKLTGWLRSHKEDARRIMWQNKSYIFFAPNDSGSENSGPIGGAGVSLTPHRSIAIDRNIWPYGLPFYLEMDLPRVEGGLEPVARLMVGQDTGSAILGPARADYFMGTGDEAGARAGLVRHPMRFTVFWPKSNMDPSK